jgi:hypothetical protein
LANASYIPLTTFTQEDARHVVEARFPNGVGTGRCDRRLHHSHRKSRAQGSRNEGRAGFVAHRDAAKNLLDKKISD